VLLVVVILFCGLVVKLAQLQAVSPAKYTGYARGQRVHSETLPATRGAILDRNGLPLVTTVTKHAIWSDSALVSNGPAEARTLASILGGDPGVYQEKLLYGGRFSYLAREVDDDPAEKVSQAKLDGVFLLEEPTRSTPADGLALSVLGMTDPDNVGTAGLEKTFNDVLGGEPGKLVQEESREGHTIPSGEHRVIPARPGSNLQLTIDRNLQFTVEQALSSQVASVKAKRGVAVVMEPHSGEVMAMASVESTGQGADRKVVSSAQNLAVTAQFEPGSVLKPMTMAAGIERLGLTPTTIRKVPTSIAVGGTTFWDEHRVKPEEMSLTDILARSDNVGTIAVADQVGPGGLYGVLQRFRFGVQTGISLPNEEPGSLPAREDWSGTSLPTLAIGQGVAVTPLQLATAYSAIANGGEWVVPTVVKATTDPSGRDHPLSAGMRSRILDPSTAGELRSMLAAVVARGTGSAAAVPGYDVAGKTGTAWKAQSSGGYGKPGEQTYVASFAGMVPAKDPKLVIVVMIDEPQGDSYSGGEAAAPAFAGIALPSLVALSIPPANWSAQATAGRTPDQKVRAAAAVAPTTTTTAAPAISTTAPPAGSAPAASQPTATATAVAAAAAAPAGTAVTAAASTAGRANG
jgi:cell division protein FtsI (penicillin-binding protein 3)